MALSRRRMLATIAASPLATLSLSAVSAKPASAAKATFGVPNNPPLAQFENGRPHGVMVELAKQILPEAGIEFDLADRPYPALYEQLQAGGLAGGLAVLRTPEREQAAWFTKPVIKEFSVIAVPKGKAFNLASSTDLIGKRVGGRAGFRYPGPIERPEIELIRAPDHALNGRKLLDGELDAALFGSITGLWVLREQGLLNQLDILPLANNAVPFALALHRGSFTEADKARVDKAIEKVSGSNEFWQIISNFGLDELMKEYPVLSS